MKIYDLYSGRLVLAGKEAMRKNYTTMFTNTKKLHCPVVDHILEGNSVLGLENVTIGEKNRLKAIAIYKVEGDKIAWVYFAL